MADRFKQEEIVAIATGLWRFVKTQLPKKNKGEDKLNAHFTHHRVRLAPGAEDNGLSSMLAALMEQNLANHPERIETLNGLQGRVAIVAEDADVAVTIHFENGRATFHSGLVGLPTVSVRGGFEQIGDMSRMESLGAFPDPRGEVNRALFQAWKEKKIRVYGLPSGLGLIGGMGDLLAVH